jgi:biotin carboxyl carrier protein
MNPFKAGLDPRRKRFLDEAQTGVQSAAPEWIVTTRGNDMAYVVLDPLRWESVEAGGQALLDQWLVSEGDHVKPGQVLAKASLVHEMLDVEAPHAGIVEQIAVSAGEPFGPGYILAQLLAD